MGFRFTRDVPRFTVRVEGFRLERWDVPQTTVTLHAKDEEFAIDEVVRGVAVMLGLPPWRPLTRAIRARAKVVSSMVEVVKL